MRALREQAPARATLASPVDESASVESAGIESAGVRRAKRRPPVDPAPEACAAMRAQCSSFTLRRTERALADFYNQRLEDLDLSVAQLPILAALKARGATRLGDLAQIVDIDPSTLTRNLSALERRALVRMKPGRDRRVRTVDLTQAGRRLLAVAYERWQTVQDELASAFPDGELDLLLSTVRRLGAVARARAAE